MLIYQHSFLFQIFYRNYMALVTRVGVSKVRMRHVNNGMTTKLKWGIQQGYLNLDGSPKETN